MVPESKFFMWRTLFALVHADNIITAEELDFIKTAMDEIDFSTDQKTTLGHDISIAKDPLEMFIGITDSDDQKAFFNYAYELVMIDGNYDSREYKVMQQLQEAYDDIRGMGSGDNEIDLVFSSRSDSEKPKREFKDVIGEFASYAKGK